MTRTRVHGGLSNNALNLTKRDSLLQRKASLSALRRLARCSADNRGKNEGEAKA
jgi:hypothetical protein